MANPIIPNRMTAQIDGDFAVFLIGARINAWWRIDKWLPVARAMPRMMRELQANPEHGLLGAQSWGGRLTIMVQYWRSMEHLMRYAHSRDAEHLPAWRAFNKRIRGNTAVGIWHETYVVRAGTYESIYANMPRFGLGAAGELVPATGKRNNARERLAASKAA